MNLLERVQNLSPRKRALLTELLNESKFSGGPVEKQLVAYVVLRPGHKLQPDELKQSLRSNLPDYMVPARFVLVKELPLTPNGKVDRTALPPPQSMFETTSAVVDPKNATEAALSRIFADVLRLGRVGAEDNFFHLGGHSLLALQVMARVRDAFKIELPLKALFDSPTVSGLAAVIDRFPRTTGGTPIKRAARPSADVSLDTLDS